MKLLTKDKLHYWGHALLHPFDGFFEIRFRNHGSLLIATFNDNYCKVFWIFLRFNIQHSVQTNKWNNCITKVNYFFCFYIFDIRYWNIFNTCNRSKCNCILFFTNLNKQCLNNCKCKWKSNSKGRTFT